MACGWCAHVRQTQCRRAQRIERCTFKVLALPHNKEIQMHKPRRLSSYLKVVGSSKPKNKGSWPESSSANWDVNIAAIMTRCRCVVDMHDSVEKVAQVMMLKSLSAVVVMNSDALQVAGSDRCVGVLDWTIIERFRKSRRNLHETPAGQICTARHLEVGSEMTIAEVADLMLSNKNEFAVVIERGIVAGYVSLIDVLEAIMDAQDRLA